MDLISNKDISKSTILSVIKNRGNLLQAFSSVYSYLDFVKNGAKSITLVVCGENHLEICVNPTENHVSQAKKYLFDNQLDEDYLVKDLFLETKEDSKLERLEYILGEKTKRTCKNKRNEFIF